MANGIAERLDKDSGEQSVLGVEEQSEQEEKVLSLN